MYRSSAAFARDGRTAAVLVPYPDCPYGTRSSMSARGRMVLDSPWGDVWTGCVFEFTPDGNALVVAGFENQLRRWNFPDCTNPETLAGHQKEIWGLALSPDGKSLVCSATRSHPQALGRLNRPGAGHPEGTWSPGDECGLLA